MIHLIYRFCWILWDSVGFGGFEDSVGFVGFEESVRFVGFVDLLDLGIR